MRLIDADAFAEFLKDAVKQQKYENTKIDRLLTVADVIEAVISELEGTSLVGFKNAPTIKPEPHWIPCSKRLPKKEERSYWICLDGGGQCQCRWTNDMHGLGANEYSEWGWHIMDKPQYSIVVAWMPLPEPWKGETK